MTIYDKLFKVQQGLKAPKDLVNSFGKYKYRSAESILEELKPLLGENRLILTLTDEVDSINQRNYVKATATLIDVDDSLERVRVSAYAREEETKKGMDGSQITGASSSYARKYALNGLFAIDDSKDSDFTNTHGKELKKASNDVATDDQIQSMIRLSKEKNFSNQMSKYIQSTYSKQRSRELTKDEADEVIKMLTKM